MNKGLKYELLTQQVYQVLLETEWPGKNICVHHDVKLTGVSGQKHQIDVYWEYELAGIKHKVAIECKEYSRPVPIGKVRDFYGLLDDLKDVKGIMVAAKGFQEGAKEFARMYGINLKELSFSADVPILAEIVSQFHISLRRHLFLIDEDWAIENGWNMDSYRARLSMFMNSDEWRTSSHLPLQTTDSKIIDSNGRKISSLEELDSTINKQIVLEQEYVFPFEDAYVNCPSGPIKIKEVLISDKEEVKSSSIRLVAEGFVKAILKDAIDGKIQNILCPNTTE